LEKLKKREPKKKKKVTGWLAAYPFQQTLTAEKERKRIYFSLLLLTTAHSK
jgi:hypothetical protein